MPPESDPQLAHNRSGQGGRLVLVHGFTQTSSSWSTIAVLLADRYEIIAVDCPGHGGSSAIATDLPTGAALLGAVGGAATYVGYSMGGRLCLHLALARPDLVQRLVLIGASPGIADPAERAARRDADERLAAELLREGVAAFLARWLAQPLFAGLTPEQAGVADRLRNTADGLASSLRLAGTGAQESLWERLGELTMPVLVVAGELDAKFTAIGAAMAAAIPAATLATVARAGHTAHLERPDAFIDVLSRWLAAT